jgi:hypothetical protein
MSLNTSGSKSEPVDLGNHSSSTTMLVRQGWRCVDGAWRVINNTSSQTADIVAPKSPKMGEKQETVQGTIAKWNFIALKSSKWARDVLGHWAAMLETNRYD